MSYTTRSSRHVARFVLFIALFGSIVAFGIALAQADATAPWAAFTSGGGHSTSQNFQVTSVIGQPIVGRSTSENFQVDAGLLGGVAVSILCVYDVNANGAIERPEAVQGVTDYLLGFTGTTKTEAATVVSAYLLSKSFDC